MNPEASPKVKIAPHVRERVLSTFGITLDELKECVSNCTNVTSDLQNASKSIIFSSATNRGRTIQLECALTSSIKYEVKLQDKLVMMEETGEFIEVLDAKPVFIAGLNNAQGFEPNPSSKFDWGDFRRQSPVNRDFGFASGQPIDRYYIEKFLYANRLDIQGRVLEVGDNSYTNMFGERVAVSDVLHVTGNEKSTIVGNLETGEGISEDSWDCIILTQTLPFIFDVSSALQNCRKALRNGGVLLATVNGISQISRFDMDRWGDFWRFTDLSLKRLLDTAFPESGNVQTYGNFLSSISFLAGLAAQNLSLAELDYCDHDYQVLIGARATKVEA